MSATERLRALLTERGVEWRRTPHYSSESIDNETVFRGEGIEWLASDHLNGRLGLRALKYEVTPEQAVEATLGRGTCRPIISDKTVPENKADLYRMLQTSSGWFDGQIEYEQMRDRNDDPEVGMVDSESTHVSADPYQACDVMVYRNRHVIAEARNAYSFSLNVQRVWTKEMTFDEFKNSEWWEPTIKKFADGDRDASEIFVRCDDTGGDGGMGPNGYVHVSAQCERHRSDWLGNERLDKGFDSVGLWLQGNGDMGVTVNGENHEFSVSELLGYIERAMAFEKAGVTLEGGKVCVELRQKEAE